MTDLIPLQTAYIRQSIDVQDNAWLVFNTKDEKIGELANYLNPSEAMSYLHFARTFELDALNSGIKFGKEEELKRAKVYIDIMQNRIHILEQQNLGLSTQLEKFIIGQED